MAETKRTRTPRTTPLLTIGNKTESVTLHLAKDTVDLVLSYCQFLESKTGDKVSFEQVVDAGLPKILKRDQLFKAYLKEQRAKNVG